MTYSSGELPLLGDYVKYAKGATSETFGPVFKVPPQDDEWFGTVSVRMDDGTSAALMDATEDFSEEVQPESDEAIEMVISAGLLVLMKRGV